MISLVKDKVWLSCEIARLKLNNSAYGDNKNRNQKIKKLNKLLMK